MSAGRGPRDGRTRGTDRARRANACAVALGALPLAALGGRALLGDLGANPVETLTHESGGWALRFLLLCLLVTPARRRLGLAWLAPLRRTFGLWAFGYAALHLAVWLVLDLGLALSLLVEEVLERPFVTAGFAAFLAMLPLAVTSTRGWQRRLGRRWVQLHRLAYAAAVLAILHFFWLVKADLLEPAVYAGALGLLLGLRAADLRRSAGGKRPAVV